MSPRGLALALALAVVMPAPAGAQEPPPGPKPIGAVAAVAGKGTITHARSEQVAVKVEDSVFVRDKITTSDMSVIRVLMGGRITITIRERSIVTITDDPVRTRVDLESGQVAFKVHDGGLRPGEIAELRTPNAITGIRGSLVVASVNGFDSQVTVVEARHQITIATRANPAQTTPIPVGHTVRVTGARNAARVGAVAKAAKDHLDKAADTAEVPGRPKDGGQERNVRFDPKIGRLLPVAPTIPAGKAAITPEGKAALAPEGRAALTPEGKTLTAPGVLAPGKVLTQPDRREEPAVTRAAPIVTPAPAPAPAKVQAPAATKAPAQLKRLRPGHTSNIGSKDDK